MESEKDIGENVVVIFMVGRDLAFDRPTSEGDVICYGR